MRLYQVNPTNDERWARLLESHPNSSVFHTAPWLRALRLTYGYEPLVFTTSPPTEELKHGIVFCHVDSWITGNRLVSLPFSDHCEPLCDSAEDTSFLFSSLQAAVERRKWKYLEIRPIEMNLGEASNGAGFQAVSTYFLHVLDLGPDLNPLFQSFDYDSVQRRIRRAERGGLVEKCGRSESLLKSFYELFQVTRDRHQLPPMPYAWFRNLVQCLGESLEFRLAYKEQTPISAIMTLRFKDVLYYKYGCSNKQFNNFGATPWLLWRAIAAAKLSGAKKFDMGRTEEDNEGLLTFKNHWVPRPDRLVYWKFPGKSFLGAAQGWKLRMAKRVFSFMPRRVLRTLGELTYRHIG